MRQNRVGTGPMLFASTSAPPDSGALTITTYTQGNRYIYKGESFYSYIWRFSLRHDSRCHGNHQEKYVSYSKQAPFYEKEKQKLYIRNTMQRI